MVTNGRSTAKPLAQTRLPFPSSVKALNIGRHHCRSKETDMPRFFVSAAVILSLLTASAAATAANPKVRMETSDGPITIELFPDKAPVTVKNFLTYVDAGFYNGTIFHRVIPGFMIQGGGFTEDMEQKPTHAPIKNEADNGLKNERGTIAMARTANPDSATAQFFINLKEKDFLIQT
jgi:peptidyl-prolyl cis-trans isomerase A (cyclophilin A)